MTDAFKGLMLIASCIVAVPAHAEKISLKCSGERRSYPDKSNSSFVITFQEHDSPVVIDLDRKVVIAAPVEGEHHEVPITRSNDVEIEFSHLEFDGSWRLFGTLNRITGEYRASASNSGAEFPDDVQNLTCKPAKPLF